MIFPRQKDVVVGYYGFGNFGDDLFRSILIKAISRRDWGNPVASSASTGRFDKVSRNLRAVRNLAVARNVTLGGGSILGARPPLSIRHFEVAATSLSRIPYCAVGVGVLENLPRRPLRLIDSMSWVGLRAEREYLELSPYFKHVHYTSDIVYAVRHFLEVSSDESAPEGVVIIPAGVGELGGLVRTDLPAAQQWIARSLANTHVPGDRVTVLLMQPLNRLDVAVCNSVAKLLEQSGYVVERAIHDAPQQTISLIARSKFVFTDRLHGAIASHAFGVPFLLSTHHEKCVDLLSDIAHPDTVTGAKLSDVSESRIASVYEWNELQPLARKRHESAALQGIMSWLDHLESRLV